MINQISYLGGPILYWLIPDILGDRIWKCWLCESCLEVKASLWHINLWFAPIKSWVHPVHPRKGYSKVKHNDKSWRVWCGLFSDRPTYTGKVASKRMGTSEHLSQMPPKSFSSMNGNQPGVGPSLIFSPVHHYFLVSNTMWGPLVLSWFISPNNYSYKYHKP